MKFNKSIKMLLAFIVSFVIVIPQVNIVSYAEIPEKELLTTKIALSGISHLREGREAQATGSLVVDGRSSQTNSRLWMVKFDFASMAESLETYDDIVSVKLVSSLIESNNDTSQNTNRTKEVDYYLLPQNMESWEESQSWSSAENAGIIDYMYDYSNAIYSEAMGETGVKATGDLKSYIIEHMQENTADTVVSLGCSSRRASSTDKTGSDPNAWAAMGVYAGKGASEPYLEVTYYGKNLVKDIADSFTFDNIRGENEDEASIVSPLTLPRKADDALVWWSSDMPEIINPYNGAVTRPEKGEDPITVTLTAEFSIDPFKGSKDFVLTVLPVGDSDKEYATITKRVELTDIASIRERNDTVQSKTYLIIDGRISQTNSRMWFTKYDLSDALEGFEPDDIKSVRFFYTLGDANVSTPDNSIEKPVDFYVLPQELEGWNGDTLIYAEAEEMGLVDYSYNKYNVAYTQPQMGNAGDYRSLNIAPSIIEHLKSNPDDMVVAMACSSRRATSKIVGTPESVAALGTYVGINTDSPAPYFLVELYDKAQTMVDDVCSNLTFDDISDEGINSVTKNLTLPSESDGVSIKWTSSDESVISSAGTVARGAYGSADKKVALTANVSYKNKTAQKTFDITVLSNRKNPAVDSSSAELTESYSEGNTLYAAFNTKQNVSDDVWLLKLTPIKDASDVTIKVYAGSDDEVIYEKTVDVCENSPIYTGNLCSYIKNSLSPVTLRVEAEGYSDALFAAGNQSSDILPALSMLTKEKAASEALKALTFDEIKGANDTESRIRYTLNLKNEGSYGSQITWSSSKPSVISGTGVVERQENDESVTLTATVSVNGYSVSKDFTLNVMRIDTTVGFLDSVLSELTFDSYIVTNDFNLPSMTYEGVTLSWVSDASNILNINNNTSVAVTRPNEKDRTVKLIATAKKGELFASREFEITVIRNDKNNLLYGKTVLEADSNQENAIDDKISTLWDLSSSGKTLYVDRGTAKSVTSFGLVYNGGTADGFEISTTYDGVKWTKQTVAKSLKSGMLNFIELSTPVYMKHIKVTFPPEVSQVAYFAAYDDELGDAEIDSLDDIELPESVSSSFDLPTQTGNGAKIEWTSGNTKAIRVDDGRAIVTRQSKTTRVLLEAKAVIDGRETSKSFYVSVEKKASSQGSGGGGGSSGTIMPYVGTDTDEPLNHNQTSYDSVFTDLADVKWAEPYIIALHQRGIVSGKGDGRYDPFSSLKREELAKLLTLGFKLNGNNEAFDDVSETDWFYPYICAVYTTGVSKGQSETVFGTGFDITRQDVSVMIARILERDGLLKSSAHAQTFTDDSDISDYAKSAVYSLRAMGIINGDDSGRFNPQMSITRAEAAKIIYLAIKEYE